MNLLNQEPNQVLQEYFQQLLQQSRMLESRHQALEEREKRLLERESKLWQWSEDLMKRTTNFRNSGPRSRDRDHFRDNYRARSPRKDPLDRDSRRYPPNPPLNRNPNLEPLGLRTCWADQVESYSPTSPSYFRDSKSKE